MELFWQETTAHGYVGVIIMYLNNWDTGETQMEFITEWHWPTAIIQTEACRRD